MFGASPGDPILPMAMSPGDVVQVAGRSETWGSDVAQRCWTKSPGVAEPVGAMSPGDVRLRVSDVASDVAIGRRDVACEGAPQSGVAQRSSFWSGDVADDVVGCLDVAGDTADALGDVAWRCEGPHCGRRRHRQGRVRCRQRRVRRRRLAGDVAGDVARPAGDVAHVATRPCYADGWALRPACGRALRPALLKNNLASCLELSFIFELSLIFELFQIGHSTASGSHALLC